MVVKNLWGDIPEAGSVRTPGTILSEQASQLEEATKQAILASVEVHRNPREGAVRTDLDLVVPSLNSYRYNLLNVYSDPITVYPVKLKAPNMPFMVDASNEQEFEQRLADALQSPEVRRILSGLLAQVRAGG